MVDRGVAAGVAVGTALTVAGLGVAFLEQHYPAAAACIALAGVVAGATAVEGRAGAGRGAIAVTVAVPLAFVGFLAWAAVETAEFGPLYVLGSLIVFSMFTPAFALLAGVCALFGAGSATARAAVERRSDPER